MPQVEMLQARGMLELLLKGAALPSNLEVLHVPSRRLPQLTPLWRLKPLNLLPH